MSHETIYRSLFIQARGVPSHLTSFLPLSPTAFQRLSWQSPCAVEVKVSPRELCRCEIARRGHKLQHWRAKKSHSCLPHYAGHLAHQSPRPISSPYRESFPRARRGAANVLFLLFAYFLVKLFRLSVYPLVFPVEYFAGHNCSPGEIFYKAEQESYRKECRAVMKPSCQKSTRRLPR